MSLSRAEKRMINQEETDGKEREEHNLKQGDLISEPPVFQHTPQNTTQGHWS